VLPLDTKHSEGKILHHSNFHGRNLFLEEILSNWTYIYGKLTKCYIARCGAETWTLQKTDQKYLKNFGVSCWRKMCICWTDHVPNEVLRRVKGKKNILQTKIKED
jgi:hypothetical protein